MQALQPSLVRRIGGVSCFLSLLFASSALCETVQFDCAKILNARPVSTLENGKLVPWSVGIDGGGQADGFATASAAKAHGDSPAHALPDNAEFVANESHPFVRLPYGRSAGNSSQARSMSDATACELLSPKKRFQNVFLFFTSAEGPSKVSITLHYSDGKSETRAIEIPDYYQAPAAAKNDLFALASDLAKWNAKGNLAEADHHFIDGWKVQTDATRVLQSITIQKAEAGYLVFWGATGISRAE